VPALHILKVPALPNPNTLTIILLLAIIRLMYIKKLIGKKCYLAPMRIEDAEKYAVWANDQEVSEYLNFASSIIGLEAERIIIDRISKEHNYAIVDSETDELIGNMGLMSINHINRTAASL